MTQSGGQRPRLAAYGREPERPLAGVLAWSRRGVLAFFALVGAVAIGRTWAPSLLDFAAPAPEAATAASPASPVAANPTPAVTPAPNAPPAAEPAVAEAASSATQVSDDVLDLEQNRAAAEEVLKARMPEITGLQYRNVKTNLSANNGQQMVDFCGEVNSLNPMGAYIGYQKFISSRVDAAVEQNMTPGAFTQAWTHRCNGTEGPKVWY